MTPAAVLLALAVAVAGAEFGLRRLAGRIADRRLTAAIGADVSVRVRGVFAGLRVLTGRALEVHAHGTDVPVRGGEARIARLDVTLRDATIDGATLRATGGHFEARLAGDDLDALAGVPSMIGTIEATDGAVRLVTRAGPSVDATLDVEDGGLVVRPASPIAELTRFRLRLPLGDLPGGARIRSVDVADGEVVVRGELDGARLTA